MIVVTRMMRHTATTGKTTESKETTVEVASSAMLTGTFAAPPVVAVTKGRTANDLTACTPPETSRPATSAKIGLTLVKFEALAAKTIAPAVGRIKV